MSSTYAPNTSFYSILKFLFSVFGRVQREYYWVGLFSVFALIHLGNVLFAVIGHTVAQSGYVGISNPGKGMAYLSLVLLSFVYVLPFSYAALLIRRFHDIGLNTIIAIIALLPAILIVLPLKHHIHPDLVELIKTNEAYLQYAHLVILVIAGLIPGSKEENRYGPVPQRFSSRNIFSLLFSFSGRISRRDFLLGFWILLSVKCLLLIVSIIQFAGVGTLPASGGIIQLHIYVVLGVYTITSISFLALMIKRLHDTNSSAAQLFLLLIPVIGALILLLSCFLSEGDPNVNKYGADPKLRVA